VGKERVSKGPGTLQSPGGEVHTKEGGNPFQHQPKRVVTIVKGEGWFVVREECKKRRPEDPVFGLVGSSKSVSADNGKNLFGVANKGNEGKNRQPGKNQGSPDLSEKAKNVRG